jgi:hypothetical protein
MRRRTAITLAIAVAIFLQLSRSASLRAQTASTPVDIPASAVRYVYLLAGNKAGEFAVWNAPHGTRNTFYTYNDRGRGPELRSTMTIGANGIPTAIQVSGHDYLKAEVEKRGRAGRGPFHARRILSAACRIAGRFRAAGKGVARGGRQIGAVASG